MAPVLRPLSETTVREVYLPQGDWVDFWTRKIISSRGEWVARPVDLATMPLYVKAGSRIPMCECASHLGDRAPAVTHYEQF